MGKSDLFIKQSKGAKSFLFTIIKILNFRVLFPGGATYFNQSNGYSEAGRHIYDIAMEMNEKVLQLLRFIHTERKKDVEQKKFHSRDQLP